MEADINATITSHILQPYDQLMNKRLYELMRVVRDEFNQQGCVGTTRVNFNLTCTVYAWQKITLELLQASSKVTENFPFQQNFAKKYKTYKGQQTNRVKAEKEHLENAKVASRLLSVRKRHCDQDDFNRIMDIRAGGRELSSKIEEIKVLSRKKGLLTAF